jgi:hypothetical protein
MVDTEQTKQSAPKTYNYTPDEIQGFVGLPADLLAGLMRQQPAAFKPHIDVLRDGILAKYSQLDCSKLLEALDSVAILNFAESIVHSEPSPVDVQAQAVMVPDPVESLVSELEPAPDLSIIDTDTARIAIHQSEFPTYRVWVFAHQLARETDNSGSVKRHELAAYLEQHGIARTDSSFRNLLQRGAGLDSIKYWNISPDGQIIYLAGAEKIAARYASYLRRKKLFACIDSNRPGNRRVQLDLHGGIADVEARVFNAWMSLVAEQHEKRFRTYQVQIAHDTLRALWGRSRNTLKAWIELAGIQTQSAYTETDIISEDEHTETRAALVPAYAYPILTKSGQQLEAWRLPNIYTPQPAKRAAHAGNRHKVRRAVNRKLFPPAELMRGGVKRSALTKRVYFHDTWQTRKVSGHFTENRVDGYKKLRQHLSHHKDIASRCHHVEIGTRRFGRKPGMMVYEYSTGNLWRGPNDRNYRAEKSSEFQAYRVQHRAYRMGEK